MHAPFETTPARDNIREDSEHNRKLIDSLCGLICRAFLWLRDQKRLSIRSLNALYPIYAYDENTIFRQIYDGAVEMIQRGEAILPTNTPGIYKKISEVLLPESKNLAEIFDSADAQELLGGFRQSWIAPEITTESCRNFYDFLRSHFDLRIVAWQDLLKKVNAGFLERKERGWFERLFPAISTFVKINPMGKHELNAAAIPFVRLADGRHICAWERGRPQVYLNNPESCPNKIAPAFLNNPVIRAFYERNLCLQEYSAERIALDEILPKYRDRTGGASVPEREHFADLRTIREAVRMSPHILDSVRSAYLLTDGKYWRRPAELHIPSGFSGKNIPDYRLAEGIIHFSFLSERYQRDPLLDMAFFSSLGCADTLRKVEIKLSVYLDMVRRYEGAARAKELQEKIFAKKYLQPDSWEKYRFLFEGFPEILDRVDLQKSRETARFLHRSLQSFSLRIVLTAANDQSFRGTGVAREEVWTAMGLLLTRKAWLFKRDGTCLPVGRMRRSELDGVYERECKHLLDLLPFQEEDRALETILSRIKSLQDQETLKSLLKNPAELAELTKARQKRLRDEQRREERQSGQERLEAELQRRGRAVPPPKEDPAYDPVPNPERRRKKLEREFQETMDYQVSVPRTTLRYTFQNEISPEEKSTLAEWYQGGRCQICDIAIQKWDGSLHFQAINFLHTGSFSEPERATLGLCWNSLCLCPNCAAKYRYGPKDISDFLEQVESQRVQPDDEDAISIRIVLQNREETIHYAPRHFLALQAAMNVFKKRK